MRLARKPSPAEREEEAKKYTEDLRKGKDTKSKITALKELGNLAQIKKSLVDRALPDVYKAIEDKDAGVRAAAAQASGKGDEPFDKAGRPREDDQGRQGRESVKIGAARGLAVMGRARRRRCRRSASTIVKNSDKKSKLGKAAKDALKAIGGESQ